MPSASLKNGIIVTLAVILLATGWPADDAFAQSRREQIEQLQKRIDRYERELRAVQRRLFPNAQFEEGTEFTEPPEGADIQQIMAGMEVRLGGLDAQLRRMNGKIEETEFRNERLAKEVEMIREDFEFRFQELERRGQAGGVADRRTRGRRPQAGFGGGGLIPVRTPQEAEALLESSAADIEALEVIAVETSVLPAGSPEQKYEFARGFFLNEQYGDAEAAFSAFLDEHADHNLAANAQFWLGESYFKREDYARAASAYLAGIQQYADGSKGPDSLLKLGMALAAMEQAEEACAVYGEMEIRYPNARNVHKRNARRQAELAGCQ